MGLWINDRKLLFKFIYRKGLPVSENTDRLILKTNKYPTKKLNKVSQHILITYKKYAR